jgi:hypothetical protein
MRATTSPQLELALNIARGPKENILEVTRVLQNHRSCNRILERVRYVRRYFPELDGNRLKIGLTKASSGMAVPGGYEIWLNPFQVSYHTVAHEFVHLLQREGSGIPQGERSCDVFALARHWTLNDVNPSYVKLPAELLEVDGTLAPTAAKVVYGVAAEAIEKRRQGLRNYIAYFESHLRTISAEDVGG